jgi:hypothetical protein
MSDVREFKVTAESMRRVGGARRTRKQAGGSAPVDTIGVVADSMKDAASHAAGAYGQTAQGVTPMSSSGTLTSQIIPPVAMSMDPVGSKGAVALAQTEMAGGQRVELKKPVHKTRVALRAPRKLRALGGACPAVGGAKTHKVRKIGLSLKKISKKLRKAHKTAKKAAVMSIDTIKDTLVKAGLLKGGSKAPEPLLRKMYADYKTTKQGL